MLGGKFVAPPKKQKQCKAKKHPRTLEDCKIIYSLPCLFRTGLGFFFAAFAVNRYCFIVRPQRADAFKLSPPPPPPPLFCLS